MHHAITRWFSLRNAQQFSTVMQQGRIVARSKHFVLHAACWRPVTATSSGAVDSAWSVTPFPANAPAATVYLGAIVAKRWARRAVTRNLVKRQIRHVMQERTPVLPHCLAIVVRQRAGFDPRQFISASSAALRAAVRQELTDLACATDWQSIAVLPQPPHKTGRPARTTLPEHRETGLSASGTMQPAP
jgi:ribonuclease P protein component